VSVDPLFSGCVGYSKISPKPGQVRRPPLSFEDLKIAFADLHKRAKLLDGIHGAPLIVWPANLRRIDFSVTTNRLKPIGGGSALQTCPLRPTPLLPWFQAGLCSFGFGNPFMMR
jgi:hypothetical protein